MIALADQTQLQDCTDPTPHEHGASLLELVHTRVRLRARRRAAWLQHLSQTAGADQGEIDLIAALDDRDTPRAEADWRGRSSATKRDAGELERVEEQLASKAGDRLQRLEALFCLSQPESDLLQTCLAVAFDANLGLVFAYLQRHPGRTYATEALAARLFDYGRSTIWGPGSPLAQWGLVIATQAHPGDSPPLACDLQILRWLQGNPEIDPCLTRATREVETQPPLASWPVEDSVQFLRRSMEQESQARIICEGPAGSGRRTLAAAVSAYFGLPTLAIDTGRIPEEEWPDCFMRAQRLAMLNSVALVWHGQGLLRAWPAEVICAPLQFVACDEAESVPVHPDLIDHRIAVPATTLDERIALWGRYVPQSAAWPDEKPTSLLARHPLVVGDIVAIGRSQPANPGEASSLCRELTRHRLGQLGRLVECPFTWDDLIVPDALRDALEDFAFEARERAAFWELPAARRLFPRGTALVGLLTGPPGTGKTMAAQVIASELDLDLFRIDLATVVSKYIGEMAKNLSQIFTRATRMNAVLLFDECDSLFSKRTEVRDAHDRYANTDTNYLLQLIEEYRGIALLATNKKNNIDPAFTRRMRFIFDFPRPLPEHRRHILRQIVGELAGSEALGELSIVIDKIADSVEASGAQIKNSVLAALFIARRSRSPLGMGHLLRGLERELGKEGRSLGRDEQRLLNDA